MPRALPKPPRPSAWTRRRWALTALGAALAPAAGWAQTSAPAVPLIGDMHSHATMFNRSATDLRAEMDGAGVTLVGWALVDDVPFTKSTPNGILQTHAPREGELWAYFEKRVARYDAALARFRLPKALTPADVDRALAGEPHVVMACESANFLEGRAERVPLAHAMGVRHLQLVHFIESPLGDLQTSAPRYDKVPEAGLEVVRACKRAGVLVDLAHAAPSLLDAALAASDAPMVWSHSWVRDRAASWRDWPNVARALSPEQARRIVAHGGVVGLWTVAVRSDKSYRVHDAESYAVEIMRMIDLLGPEGVGFGTDFEGAGSGAAMMRYSELRTVVESLQRRGLSGLALHDVCIGNYARALKGAMAV